MVFFKKYVHRRPTYCFILLITWNTHLQPTTIIQKWFAVLENFPKTFSSFRPRNPLTKLQLMLISFASGGGGLRECYGLSKNNWTSWSVNKCPVKGHILGMPQWALDNGHAIRNTQLMMLNYATVLPLNEVELALFSLDKRFPDST